MKVARGGDHAGYRLPPRLRPPDASANPVRVASQILDAVVPGFADAAGIYALEELLAAPVRHVAGTGEHGLVARRLASATAGQQALRAAFPSGEAVSLAARSPSARCLRRGAPVIYARPGGRALQRISPEARTTLEPVHIVSRRADDHAGDRRRHADTGPPTRGTALPRRRDALHRRHGRPRGRRYRQLPRADAAPVSRRGTAAALAGRHPGGARAA